MTSLRFVIVLSLIAFVPTVVRADDSKGTDAHATATTAAAKVTTVAPVVTTAPPQHLRMSKTPAAPTEATTAAPKATTVGPKATTAIAEATTAVAKATTAATRGAVYSKLAGDITLEVSDVDEFSGDKADAAVFQRSLALCVGVHAHDVTILDISTIKQAPVHSAARRLEAGSVKVRYEFLDKSNAILPANVALSGQAMTYEVNMALQKRNVPASVTMSTLSEPTKTEVAEHPATAAPATPAPAAPAAPAALAAPAQENPCAVAATPAAASAAASPATSAGASPVSKLAGKIDTKLAKMGKVGAEDLSKMISNITKFVKSTEDKVHDLKPWQQKAGIAAVSVAGAAALAGGIAGIVEAQAAPKKMAAKEASKPRVVVVKVPVKVAVQPQSVPILYDASTPTEAAVNKGSAVMNVVTFMFVGCVLLGVSGFVYYKVGQRKRASQVHVFAQLPAEEAV